ncbi:hypothetical protein [Ruficoccus sp. ZRK36]|uniref:hypothetical protein n=1 Tax=Ruficoccus sp. ZRK36 TaxID=2866311 RepID=UPI001C73AA2D|nr:hypothetical protein [Ruficoccus sp. ZRK36]QYY34761.1 hypothetical protein K0V07_10655 [Ruficoccus sp. ZRK36]
MHRLSSILRHSLPIFALTIAAAVQAADTITPRLFSPKRTGDSYWFRDDRTTSSSTIITQKGTIVGSDRTSSHTVFEANVSVIKNNATGKATEERFTVIEFTGSKNGGEAQQLLAPGTVFSAKLKLREKIYTTADGEKLSPEAVSFLNQIIALRDNSITDEDIFAPEAPVSVGESWPINADLASEDFNFDMTLQTDPKYLEGTVTLIDADDYEGTPSLHLLSEISISRVKLPEQKNLRLIKGDVLFLSENWLPQEGPVYPLHQKTEMKIVFIADPSEQDAFTPRRIMSTTEITAIIDAKPMPRDESVTEVDRTLGIRR